MPIRDGQVVWSEGASGALTVVGGTVSIADTTAGAFRFPSLSTAPTTAPAGGIYWDTTLAALRVADGSSWYDVRLHDPAVRPRTFPYYAGHTTNPNLGTIQTTPNSIWPEEHFYDAGWYNPQATRRLYVNNTSDYLIYIHVSAKRTNTQTPLDPPGSIELQVYYSETNSNIAYGYTSVQYVDPNRSGDDQAHHMVAATVVRNLTAGQFLNFRLRRLNASEPDWYWQNLFILVLALT